MSHPVPPPPGPHGNEGNQPDGSGYPGSSGQPPHPGSSGQPSGPSQKNRWPLFVGGGCGCLALIVIAALVGIFGMSTLAGDDDPTDSPTTVATDTEAPTTEEPTDEPTTEEPTTEEPTAEEPTTEEEATDGPIAGPEDVTPEDEEAVKERFVGFMQALGDENYREACSYAVSPLSGGPMEEIELDGCEMGLEEEESAQEDQEAVAAAAEMLDVDDLDTIVNDDGTVTVALLGSDYPYPWVKADDGQWYQDLGV